MAYEVMDPHELRLFKDEKGAVGLDYRGDRRTAHRVVRNFPNSNPDRFISLLDKEGQEIGMVENPDELDPASREVLDAVLAEAYFVPTILEIRSIQADGEASSWDVRTEDGPRSFRVKSREDVSAREIPIIYVTDVNNRKYRIEDYDDLDPEGKAMLDDLLPREVVRLGKAYRSLARSMQLSGRGRYSRS